MYKRISFFIFGFWFTAIVVGLIVGMYEVHNSSQKSIKQSVELHQSNKNNIKKLQSSVDDLSSNHKQLESKVDKQHQ